MAIAAFVVIKGTKSWETGTIVLISFMLAVAAGLVGLVIWRHYLRYTISVIFAILSPSNPIALDALFLLHAPMPHCRFLTGRLIKLSLFGAVK